MWLHREKSEKTQGLCKWNWSGDPVYGFRPRGGGGGVLSLEKGTDCGPTAGERWLSQPMTAKKGGLSPYHIVG